MADPTPRRVQLSRQRGWRMPENTIKVDRTTSYGNPFVIGAIPGPAISEAAAHDGSEISSAAQAVLLFQRLLIRNLINSNATADSLLKLRGKNLACWCRLDEPCHAEVLLKFANLDLTERH